MVATKMIGSTNKISNVVGVIVGPLKLNTSTRCVSKMQMLNGCVVIPDYFVLFFQIGQKDVGKIKYDHKFTFIMR